MEAVSHNLEMLADLAEQYRKKTALKQLTEFSSDQVNAGFQEVTAQFDAILFEFGPARQRSRKIREDIRRWQLPFAHCCWCKLRIRNTVCRNH
jgi:multidrug resistance protein MdtO